MSKAVVIFFGLVVLILAANQFGALDTFKGPAERPPLTPQQEQLLQKWMAGVPEVPGVDLDREFGDAVQEVLRDPAATRAVKTFALNAADSAAKAQPDRRAEIQLDFFRQIKVAKTYGSYGAE